MSLPVNVQVAECSAKKCVVTAAGSRRLEAASSQELTTSVDLEIVYSSEAAEPAVAASELIDAIEEQPEAFEAIYEEAAARGRGPGQARVLPRKPGKIEPRTNNK